MEGEEGFGERLIPSWGAREVLVLDYLEGWDVQGCVCGWLSPLG